MADLAALVAALRSHAAGTHADPAHDLAHLDRVWENARKLAAEEGVPVDATLAGAAWLHDLVALPKDDPRRSAASRLSAEAAAPILSDLGLAPDQVEAARHAIEAHSFSAGIQPRTPLARVIQDADRLDALGAVGLARCLTVGASLGRPLYDPDDPFARDRPLDDTRWTIDHFATKLLTLPASMQTATGRALALDRTRPLRAFLADLAGEIGRPAPDW